MPRWRKPSAEVFGAIGTFQSGADSLAPRLREEALVVEVVEVVEMGAKETYLPYPLLYHKVKALTPRFLRKRLSL